LAMAGAAVVTYFVITGPKSSKGAGQSAGEAPPAGPPDAAERAGKPDVKLLNSRGLSVQVASRTDPTRLAATITSKTLEPLESNRYSAEAPESFVFLRDGRTIYVKSDSARLYIPQSASGQPESGTLTGNVRIMLFDRKAGGVDPAKDTPSLTVATDRL